MVEVLGVFKDDPPDGVNFNYYASGKAQLGPHADNEICNVTFSNTRLGFLKEFPQYGF